MTRELEGAIEDDVVAWAENRGWLVRKMTYLGRTGCPDRWFFKSGRMIIIEFKRPGKSTVDPIQRREHNRYTKAGFHVHVVNNRDAACMILDFENYVRD